MKPGLHLTVPEALYHSGLGLGEPSLSHSGAKLLLDCSLAAVYTHAKDMGVAFRNPVRTPDDIRALTRRLADQGMSLSQIAAQVGRSRSWVAMYLRGER